MNIYAGSMAVLTWLFPEEGLLCSKDKQFVL
jgi:hypothetical protein